MPGIRDSAKTTINASGNAIFPFTIRAYASRDELQAADLVRSPGRSEGGYETSCVGSASDSQHQGCMIGDKPVHAAIEQPVRQPSIIDGVNPDLQASLMR